VNTHQLIALLALCNDLADARASLQLAAPGGGAGDAAFLVDRARRLVRRAALALAREQWRAEAEEGRQVLALDAPRPAVVPITPSPAGRAGGPHSRGNGRQA